jgi:protein-disulfide isomerase
MPKRNIIIIVATTLLIGFIALVVHNYKTKTSFKYSKQTAAELKPEQHVQDPVNKAVNDAAAKDEVVTINKDLLKITSKDFVLGSNSAPITFIEYASLSCPHCASFTREAFDKLKADFIDTGKVKFVYRNFPLNQAALVAAMFAQCQADDNGGSGEKYLETIKAIFKTQDSWAFDEKFTDKLESIAQLDGMSSERFKKCVTNKDLQDRILRDRMAAAKLLQLHSVPTFFINGEVMEGFIDYKTLKKIIEEKLNK